VDDEINEQPKWTRPVQDHKDTIKAGLLTTLLGVVPVFAFGYSVYNDLLVRVVTLERQCAINTTRYDEHIRDAERWKDRIHENEKYLAIMRALPQHSDARSPYSESGLTSRVEQLEEQLRADREVTE